MENACTGPNEATEALRTQRENTLEKPTYIGKKSRLQIQLGKFHPTSGPSHVAMFES
jgi:hypothetical protein